MVLGWENKESEKERGAFCVFFILIYYLFIYCEIKNCRFIRKRKRTSLYVY